jgi:hypothetical protein
MLPSRFLRRSGLTISEGCTVAQSARVRLIRAGGYAVAVSRSHAEGADVTFDESCDPAAREAVSRNQISSTSGRMPIGGLHGEKIIPSVIAKAISRDSTATRRRSAPQSPRRYDGA